MKLKLFAALAAATLLSATAGAATTQVISGTGQRALTISAFDPVGQSFVATDTNLTSFGFQLQAMNPNSANDALVFTLFRGNGIGGSVVATTQLVASGVPSSPRTPTWVDFSLSGVTLTAGQTYTAVLMTTSDRLAVIFGPDLDPFTGAPTGGDAYVPGGLVAADFSTIPNCGTGLCDTNFRFTATTPATPAVPEPASWALMIGGLGLIGGALRRRAVKALFGERSRRAAA